MGFESTTRFPPVATCKAATILLGFVILVLGLYSHFDSDWVKPFTSITGDVYWNKLYKGCVPSDGKVCPSISMEYHFIGIIIITFILSLVPCLCNLNEETRRKVDMLYHAIGALLLLAGAIVYFISVEQMGKFTYEKGYYGDSTVAALPVLKISEKVAAASLTVIQAILFGATSFFINRQGSEVERIH